MKKYSLYLLLLLTLGVLESHAQIVINEFMADNETGLQDEDNSFSDWIELKNTSNAAVNLSGWYLTDKSDDLMKWEFPSVSIAANDFLVVFASSKNRAVAGSELHTNFGLSKNGEYLALVQPNGTTIEDEYAPNYPEQQADISYGIPQGGTTEVAIDEGASCTAIVPATAIARSWRLDGYDDSSWSSGNTGVGYDRNTTYDSLINLDVQGNMDGVNASVYIRIPFTITNTSDIVALQLEMKCDDGFIAYINGEEVASRYRPAIPEWNSSADGETLDAVAQVYEVFDLNAYIDELALGPNVLAIHGLNKNSTSSDMLILPKLSYTFADNTETGTVAYLESPTPGIENSVGRIAESAPVNFSVLSGVYTSTFSVTLSSDAPSIHYTLDGSEPTQASPLYSSPITISSTTTLRARSFESGFALGAIGTENYMFLSPDVVSFSSNLPVIVIDSLGYYDISLGEYYIPNTESIPANLTFFEPGADDRTFLVDDYTLGTRAGIRRRGETSLRDTDNKPNLAIESWADGADDDRNIKPLGMPAESDWILWGPHGRDLSGMRNAFFYELSNQTGNYAVRTRFVEVFLNVSGDDVSMEDYAGLYFFMEKIKRDNDRVDVEALSSVDNTAPNVTGGYILRVDKSDPGQNRIGDGSVVYQPMYCEYPSPTDITAQQETYIVDYLIDFEAQLSNPNPTTGYPSFINVDTFVDHNIFNLLGKNADGLRYSTYMHKSRNGKLSMGPIWDFDRSIDSNGDDRDDDPDGWTAYRSETVFSDYINYSEARHWWGLLFENADFWQAWIDRWQELRLDLFSDSHIEGIIDGMAEEIAEARARDIAKWAPIYDPMQNRIGRNDLLDGTQQGEVNYMKWWLATRMDWIDSQLIPAPVLSHSTDAISDSFQLTMTSPSGEAIYYTLDGSDPRELGGTLSTNAILYTGPITIAPDSIVLARAWDQAVWGGDPPEDVSWSGLTKGIYYREDLLLTEVHYNPSEPNSPSIYIGDDFEFVEFQNTGDSPLDLTGYVIDGGIAFSFAGSAVQTLAPGELVVVVSNPTAFATRYNTSGMNIAGTYTGQLSNSGENIRLEFHKEHLYDIDFNDARGWPTAADGGGHSLIPHTGLLNLQGFDTLDYWGNWRASAYVHGSPGASDPELATSIIINEIIAHTDTGNPAPFDSNDTIELYNPTASTIVLDGSWYLSDDMREPEKWNIPSGTTINAGAWVAFDEDDFHPGRSTTGFGLDKAGEQVVLSHRPGGGLNRVVECIDFKGQANGASWGRYPDGDTYFQTLNPTSGNTNQLVGDSIQITELMYNPPAISGVQADELLEYIRLTNNSASTIALEDLVESSGTWRLDGAVEYSFASGVTMAAGEDVWMVPFDPTLAPIKKDFFCTFYGLNPVSTRLIGPYSGDLSNSVERVTLERPQASDTIVAEDISWIIVDEATWMDESPWPTDADGTGLGIHRIGPNGNDPESWTTNVGDYYNDSITYEKVSPGTSSWNAFAYIPALSDSDYADANASNGVTASIVAGTRDTNGATVDELIDGAGQSNNSDTADSLIFTSSTITARVLIDLQSVQSIYQINSYSWHSDTLQNQKYDLYYSAAPSAPDATSANAANSVELIINGWELLGSVDTEFDNETSGQIGVSWSLASAPIDARYILIDFKSPQRYMGEIDILTSEDFVINGVPKAWLSAYGLAETNQAALLDSDKDGKFNWEEYHAGTNPLDAASAFKVTQAQTLGQNLQVSWSSVTGKTYILEYKADLEAPNWTVIQSDAEGTAPENTVSIPMNGSKGFIRVSVSQ